MKNSIIVILIFLSAFINCTGNKEQKGNEAPHSNEQQTATSQLKEGQIQHTVQFNLKWDANSPEAEMFLKDGKRILSTLPSVQNFEALRQVSAKNNYKFYFTMVFENQEAYDAYNNHPDHVKFVKERWETEVTDFLEADFVIFK